MFSLCLETAKGRGLTKKFAPGPLAALGASAVTYSWSGLGIATRKSKGIIDFDGSLKK